MTLAPLHHTAPDWRITRSIPGDGYPGILVLYWPIPARYLLPPGRSATTIPSRAVDPQPDRQDSYLRREAPIFEWKSETFTVLTQQSGKAEAD